MLVRITWTLTFLGFLFFPLFALADTILTISPSSWSSTGDVFTWTVGGTPNGADYADCFNPDGSHLSRFGGTIATSTQGGPIPGNGVLQGAAAYYVDTITNACSGNVPSGPGTLHFVGVNIDSGAGVSSWLSHCDSSNSTYADCTSYLLGDNRAGYWDVALPYTGTTTPACTQDCYSNVLFIPGMEASRLYMKDIFSVENQLWEPGPLSVQQDAKKLYLDPDGASILPVYTKANGAIDTIFGYGDIYRTFLEHLAQLKTNGTYNEYAVFPYDWRMSPTSVAEDGTPYNDGRHYLEPVVESLAANSKSGKVTIVAHSNGGLVAKALMQKLQTDGKADLVDKIIFVDVPQSGTPKAIASMLHGDFQNIGWGDIGFVVSQANARALGENMKDGFALLPSRAYFAAVATPVIDLAQAPILRSTAGILGTVITSADDLRAFVTGAGGRAKPSYFDTGVPNVVSASLYDAAASEHQTLDHWTPPSGVEVVQIAGWGLDTPSGITYAERKEKFCFTLSTCTMQTVLGHENEHVIDGDGTVVYPSEAQSSVWLTYYINLSAYGAGTGQAASHGNITESAPFQALFDSLATSSAPASLPPYVTTSVPTPASTDKRLRLRLHTPYVPPASNPGGTTQPQAALVQDENFLSMTLDAYDTNDRHTGRVQIPHPPSDLLFIEQQIPGSTYEEDGSDPYIGLSGEGSYHLMLQGHASGTFTFDVTPVLAGEEQTPIEFADVPVTATTKASMDVSMDAPQNAVLAVDLDGNGTVDLSIPAGSASTQDPALYVGLIQESTDALHLSPALTRELAAQLNNVLVMIRSLREKNTASLTPQILQRIDAMEAVIESANARGAIGGGEAQTLLQMLDHEKDLLSN